MVGAAPYPPPSSDDSRAPEYRFTALRILADAAAPVAPGVRRDTTTVACEVRAGGEDNECVDWRCASSVGFMLRLSPLAVAVDNNDDLRADPGDQSAPPDDDDDDNDEDPVVAAVAVSREVLVAGEEEEGRC